MKKILIISATVGLLAAGCGNQSPAATTPANTTVAPTSYNHLLQVGSQLLYVQIATSTADMQEGLSDRASMEQDQGMLFDFGTSTTPGFWMPRMHFNLDMIWINSGSVISITPNVPAPSSDCQSPDANCRLPVYYPPSPVDQVLEVNAGWTKENNISVGDAVILK